MKIIRQIDIEKNIELIDNNYFYIWCIGNDGYVFISDNSNEVSKHQKWIDNLVFDEMVEYIKTLNRDQKLKEL